MTEPDYPYPKKPLEPAEGTTPSPPPIPPPPNPSTPPFSNQAPQKFTCPTCSKTFPTKEELALHVETVHMSPKKKV